MPLAMRPGWALQTWGKAHSSRPSAPEGPPCPWGALCAGRGPSHAEKAIPMTPRGGITGVCAVSRSRKCNPQGRTSSVPLRPYCPEDGWTGLGAPDRQGRRVTESPREEGQSRCCRRFQAAKQRRKGRREAGRERGAHGSRWTHSPAWPMPGPCAARIRHAALAQRLLHPLT